jgi:hypothetical protein
MTRLGRGSVELLSDLDGKAGPEGTAMAKSANGGESDQHALQLVLAPFKSKFDSGQQFEDVVGLLVESGRHAAVRRMLQVSRMGTKEIFGLFDEIEEALFTTGGTHARLRQPEGKLVVLEEVAQPVSESPEPVREALPVKGVTHETPPRPEGEIDAFDEVVRRVGERSEPALQELAAKALFNKGVRLGRLRQREEEIAAYDEILRRFGKSQEPALQELMATARRRLDRLRVSSDAEKAPQAEPQNAEDRAQPSGS